MHISLGQMFPHLQFTIDISNTTTPNKFHIQQNAHILRADVPPQTPIDHRCMEYHYTKEISNIAEYTYTKVALLQFTIDLWNTTTLKKFLI